MASLSIILDGNIGWRNTILVIGSIGALAFAAIATFVVEPRSTKTEIDVQSSEEASLTNIPRAPLASQSSSSSSSLLGAWSNVFSSLKDVGDSPEARLIFAVSLYFIHFKDNL